MTLRVTLRVRAAVSGPQWTCFCCGDRGRGSLERHHVKCSIKSYRDEYNSMPASALRHMCTLYNLSSSTASVDTVLCPRCSGTTLTIVEQLPMPEDDSHRYHCEKCRAEFNVYE